ncbi:class I SAM-dependent methyltransferase, partial [[Mycobacterium] zoologicum]|uniref:class I SAM-dependent methyltransferase n=1 Tax=[Mycobacterium] zoologicum TaxID=2872311 RepID=UPI002BA9182A
NRNGGRLKHPDPQVLTIPQIGAGSGSIASWLAREAGDPTLVTTTDIDTRLLGPLADAGIQVLQHNVLTDEFPAGSFDIIHIRAVLEHIAHREHVLDRISSWLAPGGCLVVVDCASFPLASSHNLIFRTAIEAYIDMVALTGTDYEWARRFPEPLQRRGFRDIGVSAMVPTVQGGTPFAKFWSLTLEAVRPRLLNAKLIGNEEIDRAQHLLADPEFFDLGPGFLAAWGHRPH